MSSTGEDDGRSPDRRASSSALFSAFRNLTGARLKSPTPPPSVASTSFTPFRNSILSVAHRSNSVQSAPPLPALGPVPKGGLKGARAPLGGPPELHDLTAKLHVSRPLPERIAAAERIVKVLEEYPVRNVLGLWTEASDLVSEDQSVETARVGFKLLRACAALPDLAPIERISFFPATFIGEDNFDIRMDIISTLTKGGRDIDACKAFIVPFVLSSLDSCFKPSLRAYKAARKAPNGKKSDKAAAQEPPKEQMNMARLFQYAIDVCKFNSKMFRDDELQQVIEKTIDICHKTSQRDDMRNAIRLFDTIITFVHIPVNALVPSLDLLCTIHRQLPDMQEQTWNTLTNLFKSHFGQAAVSALLHTLLDETPREERNYTRIRGALQVLQLLLLQNGRGGLPKVPMTLLIPALRASIKDAHETQEALVIGLLASVLAEEKMREVLLNEADWCELLDIIRLCAGRNDTRVAKGTGVTAKAPAEPATSIAGTLSPAIGPVDRNASIVSTIGEVDSELFLSPESAQPVRPEVVRRHEDDNISRLLTGLHALCRQMEPIQRSSIMQLFMQLAHRLSDSLAEDVIRFYIEERYFHPSHDGWMEACRSLVSGFLKDTSRPRSLRILCVKTLRETYSLVEEICSSDIVLQIGALLWSNIEPEEDVHVLHELVDFAVDVIDRASNDGFLDTLALLRRKLEQYKAHTQSPVMSPSHPFISSPFHARPLDHPLGSPCNVLALAFVRLFIRTVNKSAPKTRELYNVLRHLAGCDSYDNDARLTCIKLLFRLRAESNHALIVNASSEGQSIAKVLCRTADTTLYRENAEDDNSSESGKAEDASWRDQRKVSTSSPHSSLNRNSVRHKTGRPVKPVPPIWIYGGPKGLPETPPSQASRVVFSHIDQEHYPLPDDILDLEVTLWLELIISLLQRNTDWEIYSYVLVHVGPQLSNQALVRSCVAQLRMLRNVVCEQLRNSTFHEPPAYTSLKKADVAVCLFHILTVLISYHEYYEKSEEDDVVKTFLHGIGSWDRTSIWCIHALTVCCQEIPMSVSKSLEAIIQKMSQIITKPSTAIHILEFLIGVARMPELYKNFREEDFKTVFGVSFRYLQHARDQRERAPVSAAQAAQRTPALRHSGASRDFAASPDRPAVAKPKAVTDDLPQYVYSLAYHAIVFWFISLKIQDRPKQIHWITKNLQYTDSNGRMVMEEQGHVIVDMMNNVAFSDRGETRHDPNFAKPSDGEVWTKTWIAGHSLVTVETASRTGVSLITSRRPSTTRYLYTRPVLAPEPPHQIPLTTILPGTIPSDFHTSSDVSVMPDDIFQAYFSPLNTHGIDPPVPLPNDQMTRRALDAFDRNASVDGHKIGVIYIGEGQMGEACERAILLNEIGSAAYTSFLSDLGTLMSLKGATFNTGGLDRHDNQDGQYTYAWRDRVIELVFHIPTMMPNGSSPEDQDLSYANKKRHVGNDFVNIIWNDSGLPYDYETFPSQFNYVAIVIEPESRASFVDRRLDSGDPDGKNRYYKVQVRTKEDFPNISSAVEPKILCGKYLASYCRLLAINASVFSQVWAIRDGGESISSWRNRLREIKRLRERHGATEAVGFANLGSPSVAGSPVAEHGVTGAGGIGGMGVIGSPPPREGSAGVPPAASAFTKRTSVATFMSEGTNRSTD